MDITLRTRDAQRSNSMMVQPTESILYIMLSKKGKVEKKPQNLEQHRRPGKWLDCGQKRRFAVSPHSYTEGKDNGEKEDLDEDDDDVINLTRTELLLERTEANPFRRIRFSPLPPSSSSSSSTSVSFL